MLTLRCLIGWGPVAWWATGFLILPLLPGSGMTVYGMLPKPWPTIFGLISLSKRNIKRFEESMTSWLTSWVNSFLHVQMVLFFFFLFFSLWWHWPNRVIPPNWRLGNPHNCTLGRSRVTLEPKIWGRHPWHISLHQLPVGSKWIVQSFFFIFYQTMKLNTTLIHEDPYYGPIVVLASLAEFLLRICNVGISYNDSTIVPLAFRNAMFLCLKHKYSFKFTK